VEPRIRLVDVTKRFPAPDGAGLGPLAVSQFTLDVVAGEFVTVIGPSGCGKTTLLHLLAGLHEPTAGQVSVCGTSPGEAVRSGACSLIFQAPVLFEWLSAEENVLLPLRLRDPLWWAWPWRRERYRPSARAALRTVDLEGYEAFRPQLLSGGMQQRVAIARALTLDPQVLLMDEPFGALDEINRDRLNLELLRVWQERALTVVFITHSIDEAVFLSDRVVVMGRAAEGVPSIRHVVQVGLPRPRTLEMKESPEFFERVREGREALRSAL
jgi:NitT/TauT family transport system ATP-binding protein